MLLQVHADWWIISLSLTALCISIVFSWRELTRRVAIDSGKKTIAQQFFVTAWLSLYTLLGWIVLFKDQGAWQITAAYIGILIVYFWVIRIILALCYWLDIVLD